MSQAQLNRIVAGFVFFAALIVYFLTLAPTVVFWDVGEFIAAAKMLQVPHPPGSPLFLLFARIAMEIPFAADQAVRAHAVSAILSAFGIMFLYLVIVRTIENFRGLPRSLWDAVAVYGVAVIGALSLAYGTTYWDNSIEAEVYGASMFFLSAVIWLALHWMERSEAEGNERHFVLIAYLIGLSLGVHLLALLAIFPVLMIVYFKRYEVTPKSFMIFTLVALGVFFVVYPGIVKMLPGMMDGEIGQTRGVLIEILPWAIIAGVAYMAYRTYKRKQKMAHLAFLSILLILLGYTTYVQVIVRSNADPPMNENNPNNLARLTSYLGREQYGDAPLFFPRRYSNEPFQQGMYTTYSSDMDFLIRYQLNHMFFRYLGWNYIGAAGDTQDSGVSWKDTWGIPFLLGLLGLWYHLKKDWKMGLVFLAMFIILGPVLALYQNQQEPQPRERDYFYVGAFFVFSTWVAIGVLAIIDGLRNVLKQIRSHQAATIGVLGLAVLAVPVNFLHINWFDHDRSGNYVAWDYSYNMLQTCAPNAILFTNGDNDTFPLWYLQDVEGVRRDVRIVNLSLVNTPWYIQQMKDKPYYSEARAVPISLPDSRIATIEPTAWQPRQIDIPVPREVFAQFGVTDTSLINKGKISFFMRNTLQFGQVKGIRVQDIMVRNIVETNQWKYPIYFAVTCSPDSRIGLDQYLWFDGLAWRLEPKPIQGDEMGLNADVVAANLFNEPEGFSRTPQYGYKWRNVANPKVYFDENTTRLMLNVRTAFVRLAMYYANITNDPAKSIATLDRMEKLIPSSKIPLGWELGSDVALFYHRLGQTDRFNAIAPVVEQDALAAIDRGEVNLNSYWNPYRALLDLYDAEKDYDKSIKLLSDLAAIYPRDPSIRQRLQTLQAMAKQKSDSVKAQ